MERWVVYLQKSMNEECIDNIVNTDPSPPRRNVKWNNGMPHTQLDHCILIYIYF